MSDSLLTAKQERFCVEYLATGNASEAYRRAYNAENMQPATINVKASNLLAEDKIRIRVEALQKEAADKATLDRSWVLDRLMKVVQIGLNEISSPAQIKQKLIGKDKGKGRGLEVTHYNLNAATRALEALGKTKELQLFVTRHELTGPSGGPIPVTNIDLTNLTDEQLAALEPVLAAIAGAASGDAEAGEGGETEAG